MLRDWFDAAREQHDIWNKLKAAIEDAKSTGPPVLLQRNTTYARPLNVMDVDAICVNALTAEEKEKLAKEGRCFKCKKQGHISRKCPEREENKNAPCQGNQGMTVRVAAVENESSSQDKVEELAGGIRVLRLFLPFPLPYAFPPEPRSCSRSISHVTFPSTITLLFVIICRRGSSSSLSQTLTHYAYLLISEVLYGT